LLGNQQPELIELVCEVCPDELAPESTSLHDLRQDRGRKIGHAAKDKSQLRSGLLTLDVLQELERTGNELARDEVHKDRVLPKLTLEELRDQGIPPAIACLLIQFRRILPRKPKDDSESREKFVELLPALFQELTNCRSLVEASVVFSKGELCRQIQSANVAGPRFKGVVRSARMGWAAGFGKHLREIQASESELAWVITGKILAVKIRQRQEDGLPMPTRTMRTLSELKRVGPDVPQASIETLIDRYGFTGIELGKWVSVKESQPLIQWVSDSCFDLEHIVGQWLEVLSRRGNLALALGARGKGKSCAHYESSLRVINLTKTRGDGSLAHEFAHFIDQMIASHSNSSSERFLSDRVNVGTRESRKIGAAMQDLLSVIGLVPSINHLEGDPAGKRWYRKAWVLRAWNGEGHDAQKAFAKLARQYPRQFEDGREAARNSQMLAGTKERLFGRWNSTRFHQL